MARKQARRGGGKGGHGLLLFGSGLVCGLALATVAWIGGYLPAPQPEGDGRPLGHDEPAIADDPQSDRSRQYDFFTVLPEIEVVVPQREIEERARETDEPESQGPYLIQVGSFRSEADADGLRARVTLLGLDASVQTVTVDDATWHRVRVGPFDSAREADGARRRLDEQGLEGMVLRGG